MPVREEKAWWKEGAVYQVYPRSFFDSNKDGIGDLVGIREKLGYIKSLGVDIIWLNPCYKSPNDDGGYDISDYRSIMDDFGTMKDFEALLKAAHSLGLKIIMDLVVNHSSDENAWFVESRTSKESEKRDWYVWKDKPNNWGAIFGGSAWEYDEKTKQYYLHMFSKKQPDLNWENPLVRNAIFDMMNWWGQKGIDGFRMDVFSMFSKDQRFLDGETNGGAYGDPSPYVLNGPRLHEFLKEMKTKVLDRYDWLTVGEGSGCSASDALSYTSFLSGELNMIFTFEHVNYAKPNRDVGFKESPFSLKAYKQIYKTWQEALEGKGWNSLYLENHDQVRCVSRYGNTSTKDLWKKSAKMLAVMYFLMKGTAYIYQGQELGMVNYPFEKDEIRDISAKNDLRDLVASGKSEEDALKLVRQISRDNNRTVMQWDSSLYAGFSTSEPWIAVNPSKAYINVEAEEKDEDSVLNFYRKLIRLKKESECLTYGRFELLDEEDEEVFAYKRVTDEEEILIICNFTDHAVVFKERSEGDKVLLSNYEDRRGALRPYEAEVVMPKRKK